MPKLLLHFGLLGTTMIAGAQPSKSVDIIKEITFLYTDTIQGKPYIGSYEPTGMIRTTDSCYLISTIFSIDFPEELDTTYLSTDFKRYLANKEPFRGRGHVSSCSVIKLKRDLTKEWEIIFKDKRVTHIVPCDNTSFIIAGERIDMEKNWVASVSIDGNILWQNEYKQGPRLVTEGLSYFNDNIYVLGGAQRTVFIKIEKNYGRRKIRLFKQSNYENSPVLFCISKTGKLEWKRKIDPQKHYNKYCFNFISVPGGHLLLSSYNGFIKKNKKKIRGEGMFLYVLNKKGKVLTRQNTESGCISYQDGKILLLQNKYHSKSVQVYKLENSQFIQTDSFLLDPELRNLYMGSVSKLGNELYWGCTYMGKAYLSRNQDFLFCRLNNDFEVTGFRIYGDEEYNEFVSLSESYDNNLLAIGWSYKTNKYTGTLYRCINLVEFRKFSES